MGVHITLGFQENTRRGEPTLLFLGRDSGAATEVFTNPPAGFARTELFSHVAFTRQRSHDGTGAGYVGQLAPAGETAIAGEGLGPAADEIEALKGLLAAADDEVGQLKLANGLLQEQVNAQLAAEVDGKRLLEECNAALSAAQSENATLLEEIGQLKKANAGDDSGAGSADQDSTADAKQGDLSLPVKPGKGGGK